jgi:hypothetical protein
MPKVFRSTPPIDLFERILSCFGLTGLHDTTWFSKATLRMDSFEDLLPELEPYYIPCKALDYIHSPLTQSRAITILRQLCKVHKVSLETTERTCGRVKGMWYQLGGTSGGEGSSVTIDFT